jgi:hypothetical protein
MEIGLYAWTGDEKANALADYHGVQHDFDRVIKNLEAVPEGGTFVENDYEATVVKYARPFKTGIRRWPRDEWLATLSAGERELHDHYIEVRDKHIGHSVNYMEQNHPVVQIMREGGKYEIQGVTCSGVTSVGIDYDRVQDWLALARSARAFVTHARDEEAARLLAIAKAAGPERYLASGISAAFSTDDFMRKRPMRGT